MKTITFYLGIQQNILRMMSQQLFHKKLQQDQQLLFLKKRERHRRTEQNRSKTKQVATNSTNLFQNTFYADRALHNPDTTLHSQGQYVHQNLPPILSKRR